MSSSDIEARIDRLEEIAEQLEEGEVDLATAQELREEADDHLAWLREELDVDGSTLVDVSGE
jgi:exonuclease VII small subunit